ncbi:MAG: hypothetical protein WCA95_05095 [Opitutaceae bacterium]
MATTNILKPAPGWRSPKVTALKDGEEGPFSLDGLAKRLGTSKADAARAFVSGKLRAVRSLPTGHVFLGEDLDSFTERAKANDLGSGFRVTIGPGRAQPLGNRMRFSIRCSLTRGGLWS